MAPCRTFLLILIVSFPERDMDTNRNRCTLTVIEMALGCCKIRRIAELHAAHVRRHPNRIFFAYFNFTRWQNVQNHHPYRQAFRLLRPIIRQAHGILQSKISSTSENQVYSHTNLPSFDALSAITLK